MTPRTLSILFLAIGTLGLTWWLMSPPKELALGDSCKPQGIHAQVSASLNSRAFWTRQLQAVRFERGRLEREPHLMAQVNAEADQAVAQANKYLEDLYRQHPELRPSAADQMADQLRAAADAIEQKQTDAWINQYRLTRIAILNHCEQLITEQL